jgi:LAGLIDADG endonuclease
MSLLKAIQNTLGMGKINKCGKKAVIYAVESIKEIPMILNHFDKDPLITHKLSDYFIFKQCFEIIKQGEHLTERGLLEIIRLKSNLNLGLPDNLKNAFPNIMAKNRPEYFFKGIPDPFWVSGFISGDGSFQIVLRNSNNQVFARLGIHLHVRELEVLKGLATYFKLYNIESSSPLLHLRNELMTDTHKQGKQMAPTIAQRDRYQEQTKVTEHAKKITISAVGLGSDRLEKSVNLQITKFDDIVNVIIPFFNLYPIAGTKSLDFKDFKKVCDIIKTKKHLTSSSVFNKILKIKSGMNQNRKWP